MVVDDPELQEDKHKFLAWQAGLSDWMLIHNATLAAIMEHAGKMADRMGVDAAARAQAKFAKWVQEGPAKGLGRQHKLSRIANGWVPNQTAPEYEEEEAGTAGDYTN